MNICFNPYDVFFTGGLAYFSKAASITKRRLQSRRVQVSNENIRAIIK